MKILQEAIDVIKKEFENVPDSEQLTEKVVTKLQQTYDAPPVKDFEVVVNKPFTADEVRTALFAPQENQIPYYSVILLAAIEAPIGHPLSKTGSLLLTLMFLIHRKQLSFLKEFVLSEGLIPLSKMMRNDNLYERSQALEIFMSVTDCDAYDWFQPPAGHVDKLLHQKLLDLINHPHFLRNLLLNRKDSYPGGSFRALQILAFWLSWVRALYTKDQKLSLSRALMDELHQWSSQLPNPDSGILEEEVQLAKTLMDDFCKEYSQGDLTASPAADVLSISGVMLLEHSASKSTAPISNAAEAEGTTTPPPQKTQVERIQELKEEGNVRYRAGDVDTAMDKYEEALQLAGSLQGSDISTDKQHELMVALYTNLSNALWKRYTMAKDTKRDDDLCQSLLAKITEQCELALTLHPTHTKALYRLVTTMIEQRKHKEAYDRAEQFKTVLLQTKQTSPHGAELNGVGFSQQVADDIDRIARLQRKCTAVELLRCNERGTPFRNSSQWGMDKKRLKLLSTVLKRDHLHHILPTVIEETLPPSQDASNPSAVANSSSSSSSSAAVAAAKKAKEDIIKADPKVDKILSYLFEQRDESVDRDVTSRVTTKKKDTKKDTATTSSLSGASKKKSSSTAAAAATEDKATKPKVTAADRKMVQQIKRMAGTFSTLMLRAKSYSTEDPTIVGEKTKLLTEALEHLYSLLEQKQLAFHDLFLTLDDNDVLFLVSIVTHALQTAPTQDVAHKLVGGIVGADRIQSLFFLFRMEYPQVREVAASTLQAHVDTLATAGISKALATYMKLLNE